MFLNINNPVYNTIIIFSIIMLIIYIIKPNSVYNNDKHEFRQFGTTKGKTLLPIYIMGILLAMMIYIFFYYLSPSIDSNSKKSKKYTCDSDIADNTVSDDVLYLTKYKKKYSNDCVATAPHTTDYNNQYCIQQQLQNLQSQMQHLVQQQLLQQINNNRSSPILQNILPNNLNI
jgi:hypothetical protein